MRVQILGSAIAGIALLATSIGMRVKVLDSLGQARREQPLSREVLASPGPAVLGIISMQQRHAFADLMWLQMVQLLGHEEATSPATADRIEHWSEIASDLDPLYFNVQYYPAVVLVSYSGRVDGSDVLAARGERNLPQRWEFPFLLGYNAYFVHGDPKEAATHWTRAARLPKVPQYIPSLIARSTFQAGGQAESIALLEEMLEHLPEGPHRRDAEIRLQLLKSELYVMVEYDRACQSFKEQTGRVPHPKELYTTGQVTQPPQDLLGNDIYFDDKCRARTEIITIREDEAAKERIGSRKETSEDPNVPPIGVDGG